VANAAMFEYSFDFGNSNIVSGTFEGTANGNLVTDLLNITASYNGVSFNGSGSLSNLYYDPSDSSAIASGWTPNKGHVSFDGTDNNFLFIDSNYPLTNYSNFIYSISSVHSTHSSQGDDYFGDFSQQWYLAEINQQTTAVPEPETLAMMLLGLPMMAWTARRRKSA
jgi:hypothetical protein